MSSASAALYTPTPMEEAFGVFILQNSFPSSYQLYITSSKNSIQIPGQDAVAFLTTSGIHRLILRNIWNVADPQHEGTLTQLHQLHTILRLVALAQSPNHHVERDLLQIGTLPQTPKPTPTQVLMDILQSTQGQPCGLARFESVMIPSQEQLQQIYQQQVLSSSGSSMSSISIMGGGNPSGGMSPTPPPATQQQQQQPPPHSVSPVPPSFTQQPLQPEGMAAFDALDGLGSVNNAPLPALGSFGQSSSSSPVPPPTASASASNDINDDFGGFSDAAPAPAPVPVGGGGGGGLDAFGSITDAPLPALGSFGQSPAGASNNNNDDDDDFGGFADAPSAPAPVAEASSGMAALDAFGSIADAPLPALGSFGQPPQEQQQQQQQPTSNTNDQFGGFSDAPAAPAPQQVSGFDALDALGPVDNAPLPALGNFGGQQQQPLQGQQSNNNNADDEDDDDDFGGFSDAMSTPEPAQGSADFGGFSDATPAQAPGAAECNTDFGGFAGTTTSAPVASGFDALDALGPVDNAPLPALGSFGQQQQPQPSQDQQPNSNADNQDDDDDFGGFSDVMSTPAPGPGNTDFSGFTDTTNPAPAPVASGFDALDALGPSNDAPLPGLGSFGQQSQPSQEDKEKNENDDDDDFGGFSDAVSAPAPTAGEDANTYNSNDDGDDFGGFSDAVSPPPPPTATTDDPFGGVFSNVGSAPQQEQGQAQEAPGFGALGTLGPADNAPLPALGSFGQTPSLGASTSGDDDEDDDFGTFSDAAPAPAAGFQQQQQQQQQQQVFPDNDDPFGALAGVQDAPLPDFGMSQPQSDRGFGGSTSPVPQPSIQPSLSFPGADSNAPSANTTDDIFGAFDAIGGAQDAPLPNLSSGDGLEKAPSGAQPLEDSFEGSFGSFTGADQEPRQGKQIVRRLSSGSVGRRKLGGAELATETMPKDLKPHLPGVHYGRTGSMRKLPETDLDDNVDDDIDPFASCDASSPEATSSKPLKLHEPMSLGPGAETMPQDLRPHGPGQHYVSHSPHAQATPGGLQTLSEPEGDADDDFFGFESAPAPATASMGQYNESMPHELQPHAPGQHYVPHSPRADKTPGGLSTVGELPSVSLDTASGEWNSDLSHLNPPGGLTHQETPMPSDLHPHKPGQHYVPHSSMDGQTPGGLQTLPEPKGGDDDDDDFGMISGATSNVGPPDLNRQATPAAQDLQPQKFQISSPTTATVQEGSDEEDDDFGDFNDSPALGIPEPGQMKRQETPMPQDLQPNLKDEKAAAQPNLDSIVEGADITDEHDGRNFGTFGKQHKSSQRMSLIGGDSDDEGDTAALADMVQEEEDDDFESEFQGARLPEMPQPSQLSRQATPALEDTLPPQKKASSGGTLGATSIQEGDDENESESSEPEDPFSAFDTLAPDQGDIAPLHSFGGDKSDNDAHESGSVPTTQLSRQATPAAHDLDPITRKRPSVSGIGSATIQEGIEEEDNDDDWGSFSDAVPDATNLSRQDTPAVSELLPVTQKSSKPETEAIQEIGEDDNADFGSFAGFGTEQAVPGLSQLTRQATPAPADLAPEKPEAASAGILGATATEEEGEEEEEQDDFGNFEQSVTPGEMEIPAPTQMKRQATPMPHELRPDLPKEKQTQQPGFGGISEDEDGDEEDVDFGDFGSFEQAQQDLQQSASGEGFGDFAAFTSASDPSPPPTDDKAATTTNDDSFSDFTSFSPVPAPSPAPAPIPAPTPAPIPVPAASSNDDSFSDFAAFQEAPASARNSEIQQLRDEITSLSARLPKNFLGSAEFSKAFDTMMGDSFSSTSNEKRAKRCIQILSLLSSNDARLASTYWAQVLGVARDELSLGNKLLEEASGLSGQEKQMAKRQLEVFVGGLGEYVRATRSIMATIGDMLLLDISTPWNDSNSLWASAPLAKQGLEVERLWEELLGKASTVGLQRITKLESMEEIRSKCLALCPSSTFCHLSLQPLSAADQQTTKATVDWGGKQYMACSANFLANKCPFYVND